ncbi:hypothetical protein [Streptomyces sp. ML-6]|uniref:hypothetical protein n=1 Tax=Streptomyces sp. ML-6 TaxID=2982693 RepID=UPI0024C0D353|nr:hypothetical protein [Streptomyces sp. ML-6]MDK0520397.1 hypothetical protein [Streptomyces sp. ML-6]
MARFDFGRGVADFVVAPADGIWMVAPNTTVTFWTAPVDGTQYTDLLDLGGTPVTSVTSDDMGQLPGFQGPDDVFGMWADAGGGRRAWLYAHSGGKGEPGDPGAHWHFGAGSPEDATGITPVAGDIYLNTTTGDLFSYDGTAWALKANIRGPAGTGGWPTVGTLTGVWTIIRGGGTNPPLTVYGAPSGGSRFSVLPSGSIYSDATANTVYNLGIGPTSAPFGGGTYVLGMQNAATVPTTTPASGVVAYSQAGRLRVLQSDGRTVTVGSAPQNTWTPQSLGFQAWTCDPYTVANPTTKYLTLQRLYVCGINITEPTDVNSVVMFARGYGGVPSARFAAGIYREDGSNVTATTAPVALAAAGQTAGSPPQMISSHIGATAIPMPSTVTLAPGRYWITWVLTTGSTSDYAFFHVQNESPVAPANFFLGTPFARAWYLAGQTTTPPTLNQSAAGVLTDHDVPVMALALV